MSTRRYEEDGWDRSHLVLRCEFGLLHRVYLFDLGHAGGLAYGRVHDAERCLAGTTRRAREHDERAAPGHELESQVVDGQPFRPGGPARAIAAVCEEEDAAQREGEREHG